MRDAANRERDAASSASAIQLMKVLYPSPYVRLFYQKSIYLSIYPYP